MTDTTELVNRGMLCLRNGLGDIESEEFIAAIMREHFDYTKWRQSLFEGMTVSEINDAAKVYEKEKPFHSKKSEL